MREGKGLVFSMKYILAIDQSTSGTKALLFDEDARLIGRSDLPHKQKISENGWVAHDPMEIWENTKGVARAIIEKTGINKDEVIGIGISNQRETALVWDRDTGLPVYDAIVWQCARGAKICEGLSDYAEMVREHTGLRLSPYFSAAKIAWVLQNAGDLSGRHLCCGTIDSWLVFKMTHGKEFRCDYSNASRTQLFNIRTLSWDSEICSIFGIDPETLPTVTDSDGLYGYTDLDGYFSKEIPIHGVLGDSHGALFGQGCLTPGMIKATFGTGSSVMMNIGEKPIFSDAGIVTSLAWSMGGKVNYVLEGNINYTGSVIKWLVDDVKLLGASRESGEFAAKANPEDTTYLVPAFSGLGAPYWDSEAKAAIVGMTRSTGKAEIVKAAEECIAYQITDLVLLMQQESGLPITEIRVDGGPTKDKYLMQFQSDMLSIPVAVPKNEELSGIGAAYAAGFALGLWDQSVYEKEERTRYLSKVDEYSRKKRYDGWKAAVASVLTK